MMRAIIPGVRGALGALAALAATVRPQGNGGSDMKYAPLLFKE